MIFSDLFKVPSMFLSMTGVFMDVVPNLRHSTIVSLMKFSIAPLSSSAFSWKVPLSDIMVRGALSLFPCMMYMLLLMDMA